MFSQQCQAPSGSRGNLGRRVLRQRQNNGWKSRKLPGRLASETDCHVQLKASRPLTGQLAHTAPSQIYSHGQSADRDRPALFSAKCCFWRKADLRPNLHVAEGATSQIGLLLNSDLANSAPDGMFPTVLMRG